MARRARTNMAIRKLPSGAWEFDTPADIESWMKASQAVRSSAPKKERKPYEGGGPKEPNAPLSPGQAKTIGFSVGPATKALIGGEGTMTHHQALTQMGVTMGMASQIIDEMVQAGVARFYRGSPYKKDMSNFKEALEILKKHLPAKTNPYGYVDPEGWR